MAESTPGPPTTRRVLEILKEAGDEGMLGPDIARHFVAANLQRSLTWTNQLLYRFSLHGRVRRGNKERSPYYHHVPAYRWYITPSGEEYLAAGMREGLHAARLALVQSAAAEHAARRKLRDDLITEAYQSHDPWIAACEREKVIRELRAAGCTLAEIGGVFNLTRERVRQILIGHRVGPCHCPAHGGDDSQLTRQANLYIEPDLRR